MISLSDNTSCIDDSAYKDKGIDPYSDLFESPRENEEIGSLDSCISCIANSLLCFCFPVAACCMIKKVTPMYDSIVIEGGVVTRVLREPGLYLLSFCSETEDVYMGVETTEIGSMRANDSHGSPLVISAQFSYRVTNSINAHFKTANRATYIKEQAESALRAIAAKYPYDADQESRSKECLTKQSDKIDHQLVKVLQTMVNFVGVKIESFRLINVSYDPRMEKLLLAKQEAQAEVTARTAIAEGTTGIIHETLNRLKALGIELTSEELNKFATNLTMILVNHGHTSLNIFDNSSRASI